MKNYQNFCENLTFFSHWPYKKQIGLGLHICPLFTFYGDLNADAASKAAKRRNMCVCAQLTDKLKKHHFYCNTLYTDDLSVLELSKIF
jgi:hypothetical protein